MEEVVPQHRRPLPDRRAANARVVGSVSIAFLVVLIVFGGFYLGSRLSGPSTLGATTTTPEGQPSGQ
jgi:hypothetical protein